MSTPSALAAAIVFSKEEDFAFLGDLRFLDFVFFVAIVCKGLVVGYLKSGRESSSKSNG